MKRISIVCALAALCSLGMAPAVAVESYPVKPIVMVIPYAAGGSADVIGRVLAQKLGMELGQPVVVELRGGAGTVIGTQVVAKNSAPDGYTLLFGANSAAINAALMTLPYDAAEDLTPVAGLLGFPSVLVTSANAPYRTAQDVIGASKERDLTFGSSGLGTHSHMSGELFAALSGARIRHIPYKGSGAVYPDLIAGRVTMLFDVSASAIGFIKGGKVKPIAVTSKVRSKALPDTPTLIEQGVKDYENLTWFGIFAPANTPRPIVAKLNDKINGIIRSAEFATYIDQWGGLPLNDVVTPEDLGRLLQSDTERWRRLVQEGWVKRLN